MGNEQLSWSWVGSVPDEAQTAKFRGLLVVDTAGDEASVHFSDGKDSFTGTATRQTLASPCEDTIAPMHTETSFDKFREVFDGIDETSESKSAGSARIAKSSCGASVNDGSGNQLRVAASWGTEFGLSDVHIDVAALPLNKTPGNTRFLDAAFARLRRSREEIANIGDDEKKLSVEIEDLTEAHRYLMEAMSEEGRRKRLQNVVDELNAFKRKCKERAGLG